MKYGIICAMESEINLLKQDITIEKTATIANRDFICGKLYQQEVVLVMSRIGKVASASTATTLIDRFGVDAVIFCGTAGGIAPELNVGDVVIGDRCVQHDIIIGDELFTVPRLNIGYFESNQALTDKIHAAVSTYIAEELKQDIPQAHLDEFHIHEPKAVVGTIASGDQFICDGSKNAWLREHVENITCVEMEGAAVSQVCYEFGIPFSIIRVISDSASDSAGVDFDAFVAEAACHFTRGVMKAFLLRA